MGIFSEILDSYKVWRARKTENRKEVAEFLDAAAKEASELANNLSKFLDAAAKEASELANNLSKCVEIGEGKYADDVHSLYYSIQERCRALDYFFYSLTPVLSKDKNLRDLLVIRLSRTIHFPYEIMSFLFHEIDRTYKDDGPTFIFDATSPPRIGKIRQAVAQIHQEVGTLRALAAVYRVSGKSLPPDIGTVVWSAHYGAEEFYERALETNRKVLGAEDPYVVLSLNNLALSYSNQGRYEEAEPLYKRALAIREKALGLEHPAVAQSLNNLALLYCTQGKYGEAEPLYKRALAIREKALGPEHPAVATVLENYASLLRATGKDSEAEKLESRASAIRKK